MFKFIVMTSVLVLGISAHAGDNGGGTLECVSSSSRTNVKGSAGAPWNGIGPASLVYTVDGKSLEFNPNLPVAPEVHLVDFATFKPGQPYQVMFKRSVLENLKGSQPVVFADIVFQLRSNSKMKEVSKDVFTFTAVIPAYTSLDPRKGSVLANHNDYFDKDIEVNCKLDVTL